VRAAYPGPMGATESLLGLEAWDDLVRDNPVLASLEPDVEALLVRRTGGATASSDVAEHWIVPIDACYRLVAVLRRHWKGLGGGSEVRRAIDGFFDDLRTRSRSVDRQGDPRR